MAAQCTAVASWLVNPGLMWAVLSGVLSVPTVLFVVRRLRVAPVAVVLAGLTASLTALSTSWRVREIENHWPDLREDLIRSASDVLEETLFDAVELARALADSAAATVTASSSEAFDRLEKAVDRHGPEQGAVMLDSAGRAVAWAGKHRLSPQLTGKELSARITPFYVILEAQRQEGAGLGVGQVVLAADSAVPDRDRTLAHAFARKTGSTLEFYAPQNAPGTADVFDYYLEGDAQPDTLFTVRTVPPTQGTFKLDLLAGGTRTVTVLLIVTLVLMVTCAGAHGRWVGAVAIAGVLILTPAGTSLELGELFSGATYFLDVLGPVSASAGSLLVGSALLVVVLVPLRRLRITHRLAGVVAAAVLIIASPYAMAFLAAGITPPAAQVGASLWLGWGATLTAASAVPLLLTSILLRGVGVRAAPLWTAWIAGLWAAGNAVLGLLIWQPIQGWPAWYPLVWIPPVVLAVLPARRLRLVATTAIVAGSAAALLTWGSVVEGRLLLAGRDATRVGAGDPFARGLLDGYVSELQAGEIPRTAAQLYASWRRSSLSQDDYPAVLATWDPAGNPVARLDLAKLELRPGLLHQLAATARDIGLPTEERVVLPPTVFVSNVPFSDGSVVSVAVGPLSRLVEPVRVGRFLRGERRLVAPYRMSLAGPIWGPEESPGISWQREGWTVRGVGTLRPSDGAIQTQSVRSLPEGSGNSYHVLLHVPLGGLSGTLVRGALVLGWSALFVGLLWLLGEGLTGNLLMVPVMREMLSLRSYRARLTVALASFFILPTLTYATWSIVRLRVSAIQSGDLVIQQTLSDAVGTAQQFQGLPDSELQARLSVLAEGLNADLLWYEGGTLRQANLPVLDELGLLDRYLPADVYRELALREELEVTYDELIGGHATRVVYRGLSEPGTVLAVPRLVDVRDIQSGQEDLLFGLLLATLLGLGAAAGLAAVAARSLARPVSSLRGAAEAVGKGYPVPGFQPGAPTEFVSVFHAFERMAHDVEASQAALEAARRRTAAVLRNVVTAVVALDHDLMIMIANPRAEHLLGSVLPPEVAVDALTGPEWAPVWQWVREFLNVGKDSDSREFTVGASLIRGQVAVIHGPPRGCVLALDDTTELTRAVRVLAWGELARQVAHEIKNPLTPIRLGIQHLIRAHQDGLADFGVTLDRTARRILAEIERLDAIARAFARFGAPPAEAEPLSSSDLVAIARDAAGLYALSDGTTVFVEADKQIRACVRKDELKEVLVNLVENARDAGATQVVISVRDDDADQVTINVSDNGPGIPEDDLPLVFEPHFSTTTSGTGLGLAICKRLVESWGGEIQVASESGSGTTVRISLTEEER